MSWCIPCRNKNYISFDQIRATLFRIRPLPEGGLFKVCTCLWFLFLCSFRLTGLNIFLENRIFFSECTRLCGGIIMIMGGATTFACKSQGCQWAGLVYLCVHFDIMICLEIVHLEMRCFLLFWFYTLENWLIPTQQLETILLRGLSQYDSVRDAFQRSFTPLPLFLSWMDFPDLHKVQISWWSQTLLCFKSVWSCYLVFYFSPRSHPPYLVMVKLKVCKSARLYSMLE